jgi:hypothetical protein
MNKNVIIIILVVVVLAVVGYSVFSNRSSAPIAVPVIAPSSAPAASQPVSASQPAQTGPVAYTDASQFASSFLQCSPSELKMPFGGTDTYVITVFGVENSTCHFANKVVDKNSVALQSGMDCQVPKALITSDVLGHLFGADKAPGKESVLAVQTKLQTDYCKVSQ